MLSGSRCIDWGHPDNKKVSSWHTITGIFNHVFYNDCGQVVAVPFLSFDTVWELFCFFWGFFFSLRQSKNSHIHSETAGLLCPHFSCGTMCSSTSQKPLSPSWSSGCEAMRQNVLTAHVSWSKNIFFTYNNNNSHLTASYRRGCGPVRQCYVRRSN